MKKVTLWSSFISERSERIQNSSILSQNISRWDGKVSNFSIESFNNRYLLLHDTYSLNLLTLVFINTQRN